MKLATFDTNKGRMVGKVFSETDKHVAVKPVAFTGKHNLSPWFPQRVVVLPGFFSRNKEKHHVVFHPPGVIPEPGPANTIFPAPKM